MRGRGLRGLWKFRSCHILGVSVGVSVGTRSDMGLVRMRCDHTWVVDKRDGSLICVLLGS